MNLNSYKEIGGYFGLELSEHFYVEDENVLMFNLARNCLRYVIKAYDIKEIYIPYYTCPVVLQALKKENCEIKYYHIDEKFMPTIDFDENDYILYTNYFGICAKNVKELTKKYKNLIVDNAQAFYMPKYGIASFNSVRKFFGVSDGAFLFCDRFLNESFEIDKTTINRFSHLLKRKSGDCSGGYIDFKKNEKELDNEDIKIMSNFTKALIRSLDVNSAKERRLENFNYLHSNLSRQNELKVELDIDDVPMIYPFLIENANLRKILIDNKIYVAQYWSVMPNEYKEGYIQKYLVPLPIDQRYGKEDMERILQVIEGV